MNFVFRSNRISVSFYEERKMPFAGHYHNDYMALNSITDTKTGNPVIWMVAFYDKEAIHGLWKVPEGLDFILLVCPVSITVFGIQLTLNKP